MKYVTYAVKRIKRLLNYDRLYSLWIRHRFHRLDSVLDKRVAFKNSHCISIGLGVEICAYTSLNIMTGYRESKGVFNPSLEIGDGCTIGRFCQISCTNRIVIENDVLITENVLITDTLHGYEDPIIPIIQQPLISLGPIIVGTGTWLCNGARIVGKVRIGKHCVIGANAYVDKDVPDYCVVAGVPGRIVKRYDSSSKAWIRVNEPLK